MARARPRRRMGLDSVKAGPPSWPRRGGKGSQFRTEESVPLQEREWLGERGETGRGLEGLLHPRGGLHTDMGLRAGLPGTAAPSLGWNCYWNFPSCRTRVFCKGKIELCALAHPRDSCA